MMRALLIRHIRIGNGKKQGVNIRPLLYQLCVSLYCFLYPLRLYAYIPLRDRRAAVL